MVSGCPSRCGQENRCIYCRNLPKDPDLRRQWIDAFPAGTNITPTGMVCEVSSNLKGEFYLWTILA